MAYQIQPEAKSNTTGAAWGRQFSAVGIGGRS